MPSISVIIHTKNAAATLAQALKSVAFADEVLIIDMDSSDETLTIAEKAKAKIHHVPDVGYADPARNFGLQQASSDWILVLDADEEVPPSLKEQLLQLSQESSAADAYYLPRKNMIFKFWMAHTGWWPDYQMRFFKRGKVTWPKAVHGQPRVEGQVEMLPPNEKWAILHHNYPTVESYISRLNRYTSLTEGAETTKPFTSANLLESFTSQFNSRFFANEGIKDGAHGLSLSLLQAMYELVVQLKHWEKQDFVTHPSLQEERQVLVSLAKWQKEIQYWRASWEIQHSTGLSQLVWRIRRKLKI